MRKTARVQTKAVPKKTKTQIVDLECENLADQVRVLSDVREIALIG